MLTTTDKTEVEKGGGKIGNSGITLPVLPDQSLFNRRVSRLLPASQDEERARGGMGGGKKKRKSSPGLQAFEYFSVSAAPGCRTLARRCEKGKSRRSLSFREKLERKSP